MIARAAFADYGVRPLDGRRLQVAQALGLLRSLGLIGLLLMIASIPLIMKYGDWRDQQALRRDWSIVGPSCPIALSFPITARVQGFDYGGARFERRFGHVACAPVPKTAGLNAATYPVCQFSGPAAVAVIEDGRTTVFNPGVGRAATVSIRDGQVSCVIGGWFQF